MTTHTPNLTDYQTVSIPSKCYENHPLRMVLSETQYNPKAIYCPVCDISYKPNDAVPRPTNVPCDCLKEFGENCPRCPRPNPTVMTSGGLFEEIRYNCTGEIYNDEYILDLIKQRDAALTASKDKEIERLRDALAELQLLGEQGMKPEYHEWICFHDKVSLIAREALKSSGETA